MFCKNCGADIADNSVVCPKCGSNVNNGNYYSYQPASVQKAPNSIAGFVCSLISLFVPILGLVLAIIGLVLCSKGKKAVSQNPAAYSGTGFLTAGTILGILGIVSSVLCIFYFAIAGAILGGTFMSLIDIL